jgi:hypothetical protein
VLRMYRYSIPVDGQPHVVHLTHEPVKVAAQDAKDGQRYARLSFWAPNNDELVGTDYVLRAFATGEEIPLGSRYLGTTERTARGLVWHLFEVNRAPQPIPLKVGLTRVLKSESTPVEGDPKYRSSFLDFDKE